MSAPAPTPWAVICPWHGRVYLTEPEYVEQLDNTKDVWRCTQVISGADVGYEPLVIRQCGLRCEWDGPFPTEFPDPSSKEGDPT